MLGVRGVRNQLTVVRPDQTAAPRDADIQANAKSVLEWSPDVDASSVGVSVDNGAVFLSGSVASYWQRDLAETLVTNINGVVAVRNELAIVPTEYLLDEAIGADIEASLQRSASVSADDVAVRVEQGIVTLTGVVPTFAAQCSAERIAQHAAGVRDVRSQLSVTE